MGSPLAEQGLGMGSPLLWGLGLPGTTQISYQLRFWRASGMVLGKLGSGQLGPEYILKYIDTFAILCG